MNEQLLLTLKNVIEDMGGRRPESEIGEFELDVLAHSGWEEALRTMLHVVESLSDRTRRHQGDDNFWLSDLADLIRGKKAEYRLALALSGSSKEKAAFTQGAIQALDEILMHIRYYGVLRRI